MFGRLRPLSGGGGGGVLLESLWLANHCCQYSTAAGVIMSLTGQPSSSRRAGKAPMERLTPLAEKNLEIANLQRQVQDFRQQVDELWTENEDFRAQEASSRTLLEDLKAREDDLRAKNEIIKGLSSDLAEQDLEINSYKERNAELQAWFRKHYDEARAANERYSLEVAGARKITDEDSGPVPLGASRETETRERAKPPQPQQSSSDTRAKVAHGPGSKATFPGRSLTDANPSQSLNSDELKKKKKEPRQAKVPGEASADKRYVVPPPDVVESDQQNRANWNWSAPTFVPSSPPEKNFSRPLRDQNFHVSQSLRAANQSLESCRGSNGQDHSRKRKRSEAQELERRGSPHSRTSRETHSEDGQRSDNAHMDVLPQQNNVHPNGRTLTDSTAPRGSPTGEPTITRSNRGDFSMLVSEVEANNCTSDIIPDPVLAIIRQQIAKWNYRDANWTRVLGYMGLCVDRRIRHRRSNWADGDAYACSDCRDLGQVCSVLEKKGNLRFLPLK